MKARYTINIDWTCDTDVAQAVAEAIGNAAETAAAELATDVVARPYDCLGNAEDYNKTSTAGFYLRMLPSAKSHST